jgi:ketosteroid isomerase-like protein
MKVVKNLILILMFAIAGLAYANVEVNDDTRKELEAVYAKIDAAVKAKDVKTLASLLSEDYEKLIKGKTLKRDEAVAQMKDSFKAVKEILSVKTTIDKIKQVEGNEIVDYSQTAKVTVVGEDGRDQTVVATFKGRDWWVKNDEGNWICVSSERMD